MSMRDREPDVPGPLKYAPKWARMAAPQPESVSVSGGDRPATELRAAQARPPERKPAAGRQPPERKPPLALPAAPQESPPPWKLAKQRGRFEGDLAIKELRERMALAPDQPPEPPLRDDGSAVFGMVGRLAGLAALGAVAAYGFVWISAPRDGLEGRGSALAAVQNALLGQRPSAPAVSRAGLGPASMGSASFKTAVFHSPAVPAARTDVPRDEAPAMDRPQLLAPVPWPVPDASRDLANNRREIPTTGAAALAAVPAPNASASPVPPTQAEADTAIPPPPAAAPRIANEDLVTLLARGRTQLANGDVSAARLAFRRAAEGGDAQAALALGGTFDPLVLRSLGVIGVAADPDQARGWYRRAAELGSRDAPQRLNQLAQSTP